jgi:hypothetical protein
MVPRSIVMDLVIGLKSALANKAAFIHTHSSSNITDFVSAARTAFRMIVGTTSKSGAFPIFKSVTVSDGNAVVHLTNDGLSTGTALFTNGPDLNTFIPFAPNSTSPHFFGTPVLSNSNKTLTVPVTKSVAVTVSSTSVLAAPVAANGSTVFLGIFGN